MRDKERDYIMIGILRGAGGSRCETLDIEIFSDTTQTDWSKVSVFTDWIKGLVNKGP